MKDYKIGYFNIRNVTEKNKEKYDWNIICNRNFIEYIDFVNETYNLGLNIIEVQDYTKEKCDLVIYEQCYEYYDDLYNRSAFKRAKGNPKFLMYFFGEPHNYPYWYCGSDIKQANVDNKILRTLINYVPFCSPKYKCYAISMYEDTEHNCCMPYCIDTYRLHETIYARKDNIEKNKGLDKTKFCSMVFWHGTKERELIYNLLSEYKHVDCYGGFHKNMFDKDYYTHEDLDILLPNYKFNICFENTHSDYDEAYITEKICRAFQWGTIPIYWGNNKQIYEIFNKKSFINLTDVPENKWVDIIKEYDTNDELYKQTLNESFITYKEIHDEYFRKKEKFIAKVLTEKYK